jgi:4'-phosphopantetheinyl transferase
MQKVVLHLWFAYPGDLSDPGIAEACAAVLNDAERAQAARFRFERHRHEYVATHALGRIALSHSYPLPPQAWSYSANKYGKPAPIPDCGLRFNQSNSVGLAVCLVASAATRDPYVSPTASPPTGTEVGVDVESSSRAEEIVDLASHVFSLAEQAQLEALPAADRPGRALSLWTLKEAYIKARGMGLSLPLRKISFLFGGTEGIRLRVEAGVDDDPARWRFCLLNHMEHRIALVVQGAASGLQVWESHPLLSTPRRLPDREEPWFPILAAASQLHQTG